MAFDYALVRVDQIDFDRLNMNAPNGLKRVEMANFPTSHIPFSIGTVGEKKSSVTCRIVGWGKTWRGEDLAASPVLLNATVDIMSRKYCNNINKTITGFHDVKVEKRIKNFYSRVTGDYSFCAGLKEGGQDTCQGDSGGPLYCLVEDKWVIFGVTSHGPHGCKADNPGIYATVSRIVPWIEEHAGLINKVTLATTTTSFNFTSPT